MKLQTQYIAKFILLFMHLMVMPAYATTYYFNDGLNKPNTGEWRYYSYNVVSGGQYRITLSPIDGNSDLYIRLNYNPSNSSYANKSEDSGTNSESITWTATGSGSLKIGVYCYKQGSSGIDNCEYSGSFRVISEPSIPSAPSSLGASNITHNSARVSWSSVSGATYYQYRYRSDNNNDNHWSWTSNSNRTYVDISSLISNEGYEFQVRACSSVGCSSEEGSSIYDLFETLDDTLPDLIVSIISIGGNRIVGEEVSFTATVKNSGDAIWDQQILVANDDFKVDFLLGSTVICSTSYNTGDIAAVNGSKNFSCNGIVNQTGNHSIKARIVRNTNAPEEKDISNNELTDSFEWKGLTIPSTPNQPIANNITLDSARVSWSSVSHASYYIYQFDKNTLFTPGWGNEYRTESTVVVLTNLDANTSYDFRVKACNSDDSCSDWQEIDNGLFTTLDDAGKPNLRISGIEITSAIIDEPSFISISIINDGEDAVERPFLIQVKLGNTPIALETITDVIGQGLAIRENIELAFNNEDLGQNEIVVTLDASNTIDEANELDNQATTTVVVREERTADSVGTTIISHGYTKEKFGGFDDFDNGDWQVNMAEAIVDRSGGAIIRVYNKQTGVFDRKDDISSCTLDNHLLCEQILIFDWRSDSNDLGKGFSEAAGEALFVSLLEGERLGHFSLDNLHFIGHSRGTVVNSEAIERLLSMGKSIDHVTMLDPHDWGLVVIGEDFDVNPTLPSVNIRGDFVRPGVVIWQGTAWADNYFQDTNNFDNVGGRSVVGTNHEVHLPQIGHSAVHAWYHGTVDHFAEIEDLPNSHDNPHLFAGTGSNRTTDGFNQGRIAKGSVPQEQRPTGQSNPQFSFSRIGHGIVNGNLSRLRSHFHPLDFFVSYHAGWGYHGGSGTGKISQGQDSERIHNLVLDESGSNVIRNRIYLSDNIEQISFYYDILATSDDERLVVSLCGTEVHSLGLETNNTWQQTSFTIPKSLQGRSCTLAFELQNNGLFVDSEVRIDNIVFGLPQPKGEIQLDSLAISNSEGNNQLVKIIRLGGTAGSLAVDYKTVEGSAKYSQDFMSTSGRVIFADGVTSKTITISVIDDDIQENTESFYFVLTNNEANHTATLTIVDDDAPSEQVQSVVYWYKNNGSNIEVEFKSNTQDAIIYYTLDGSNPTVNSRVISNGSKLTFTDDAVIKAMAVKEGFFDSQISTFNVLLNRYKLNISNNSHCTINFQPNTGVYKHGSTVSLQTANCDGYRFRNWSGDISSSEVTAEVLMDGNKNIQANFDAHAILANSPQSSLNPARSTDSVTFSVDATSTLGFVLTYQWSAQCSNSDNGTFSVSNANQVDWTAPALAVGSNDLICNIRVEISDTESLSKIVEIEQIISSDAIDDTPDAFVLQDQQVREGGDVLSNIIQVTGINVPVTARVSTNSQISVNDGSFTSNSATVQNNDFVQIKAFVSNNVANSNLVNLNIGNTHSSYVISVLGQNNQVKATTDSVVADSRYENELIGTIVQQSEQVVRYFASSFTDTLIYSIISTNTSLFTINSVTGEISLNNIPNDVDVGTQTVLIQATDSHDSSATVMLYVPIINVNDVPQVTTASIITEFFLVDKASSGTIIVNSAEMNQYFIDQDGDTLTYTIAVTESSTNLFAINSTSGELIFSRALNNTDVADQKVIIAVTDMHQTTAKLAVTIPIITSQSYRLANFDTIVDAQRNAVQQSEIITLEGFRGTTMNLSITGGEYRVRSDDQDWSSWLSESSEIEEGQQLQVRHISASNFNTTQITTIKIGSHSLNFLSVTKESNLTPLSFGFAEVYLIQPNQVIESDSVMIKGLDGEAIVSVSGGQYRLDNGSWQSLAGVVRTGQVLQVRMIASNEYATSKTMQIMVGDLQVSFVTHTVDRDTTIDPIVFNTIDDAPTSTLIFSNLVYITGINTSLSISISGINAEFSINGRAFTNSSGQINNGDSLRLRLRSAETSLTTTSISVNLGSSRASFTVITKEQHATDSPDTQPPALQVPNPLTIQLSEGTESLSASDPRIVSFLGFAYAVDDRDGIINVSNNVPQTLPVGETIVTFRAEDNSGNEVFLDVAISIQLPPDTVAPVFSQSILPELNLSATGFYTPISQLNLTTVTATDNRDGVIVAKHNLRYPMISGKHNIVWSATDKAGNKSFLRQVVNIYPRVNLSNDQYVAQDGLARIQAILQGPAPNYPVVVPIALAEHPSLNELNLVIGSNKVGNRQQGLIGEVSFSMIRPNNGQYIETNIGDHISNAVKGNQNRMKIHFVEAQVSPIIRRIIADQNGINTAIIDRASTFKLSAEIVDPNANETHIYAWEYNEVGQSLQTANTSTVVVDISQGTGNKPFRVKLTVTDSDGLFTVNEKIFRLIDLNQMSQLSNVQDSDNDGISDQQEGYKDADDDGILDHLDDNVIDNIIQTSKTVIITISDGTTQIRTLTMNTQNGYKLKLGSTAIAAGRDNVNIQFKDLIQHGNWGTESSNATDTGSFNFHGDAIDFEVSRLNSLGQSIQVVVPLNSPLPNNAHYRKFKSDTGWQEFKVDTNNKIESAISIQSICPEVEATNTWTMGLTAGHDCLRLTIEDGGANDSDGERNAKVSDPGAIFTLEEIQVNVANADANHTNLIKAIRISANQDNLMMSTLNLTFSVSNANISDVIQSVTVYKDDGDGLLDTIKDSKVIDGQVVSNQSNQSFAFDAPQAITESGIVYYLIYNQ